MQVQKFLPAKASIYQDRGDKVHDILFISIPFLLELDGYDYSLLIVFKTFLVFTWINGLLHDIV